MAVAIATAALAAFAALAALAAVAASEGSPLCSPFMSHRSKNAVSSMYGMIRIHHDEPGEALGFEVLLFGE